MRFGQNLSVFIIPEWKQCYLNYQCLKMFVQIIKSLIQHIQIIDIITQQEETANSSNQTGSAHLITDQKNIKSLKIIRNILYTKLYTIDQMFRKEYLLEMQLAQLFYQMKTIHLKNKFNQTKQIAIRKLSKRQTSTYLMLIQYIYVQMKYLQQMTQMNLQGQRKLLKKYKKNTKQYLQTPSPNHLKINRFKKLNVKFIDDIENYYVQKNIFQQQTKDSRQFLRKCAERVQTKNIDSCLLGIWIGISVSLIVVLIFIIALNQLDLDTNHSFSRDFPTWRGIAIFIFYIWILGFNIYMYEQYKITHRLIFKFDDHHYSRSVNIFKFAGFHSTIFLILFLIYIMTLAGTFELGSLHQGYLALISWGIFLLSIFIPLPIFNLKGRIYALKLILESILSPFIGVTFPVIWMTDQVVSLVTPLKDFAYTICYYTEIDLLTDQNPCKKDSKFQVILIVAIVALGYRMLQCMRQGYDNGKYFFTPFFWNTLKYATSLVTAILAFQYKLAQEIFAVWITFAALSTLYSYGWDLKMDWALLQKNDRNPYLRKYLSFQPRRNYYIICILNLILRLSWILTLSPGIINLFGNKNVFVLVTGVIQIFRRGVWNLLRVQKQHLQNCGNFKAVPDTSVIEKSLTKFDQIDDLRLVVLRYATQISLRNQQIKQGTLKLIRQKIQVKQKFYRKYNSQFEVLQLKQIQDYVYQAFIDKPQLLKKAKKKRKQLKKKQKKDKKAQQKLQKSQQIKQTRSKNYNNNHDDD